MKYKAYIFDYDGTLALTRQPLTNEVAALLCALFAGGAYIDIITGSEIEKVEENIRGIPCLSAYRDRLYVQPTTGAVMFAYDTNGARKEMYHYDLSDEDVRTITEALSEIPSRYPDWFKDEPTCPRIQNRKTEITFSALGSDAPLQQKLTWDQDGKKRDELVAFLRPRLPGFEVVRGGTTSIDVTQKGIDKAFGIEKFLAHVGLVPGDALFAGDALMPGGTDYTALKTGVDTLSVSDPNDLLQKMSKYVDMLKRE